MALPFAAAGVITPPFSFDAMGVCASTGAAAFAKTYEVDEAAVLGQGSYGTVLQGRNKRTGDAVVVKRIDKAAVVENELGAFWQDEVAALQQCTPHPNLTELLHAYETPAHAVIVTEMALGGELFQALIRDGAYSEWDAKRFARDIFEALRRIHGERLVHRDVKPENLLLTSKDPRGARIKLGDFGSAMPQGGTSFLSCTQLTWAYCAPEILREMLAEPSTASAAEREDAAPRAKVANASATAKSDVWSVGIVLYVLLSGVHPFDPDGRQTKDQIISNVLRGRYSLTEPPLWASEISAEAKALLRLLLDADPSNRPTASEALAHAWFRDATTPRVALQVSVSNGLGQYQLAMQKKFRTSVIVAMAAQSLRRSLERIRNSKSASGHFDPTSGDSEAGPPVETVTAQAAAPEGHQPYAQQPASDAPAPPVRQSSAASKLFRREEPAEKEEEEKETRDGKTSEQQSMDLIDEFDGGANATRAARPLVD